MDFPPLKRNIQYPTFNFQFSRKEELASWVILLEIAIFLHRTARSSSVTAAGFHLLHFIIGN